MLPDDLELALRPSRMLDLVVGTADAWQARALDAQLGRMLLLCHRQSGKSTTVGAGVYHTAHYEGGTLQVLLAPSERQSSELMRKVKDAWRAHPAGLKAITDDVHHIELENGSRVVALPGKAKTIRGLSKVRRLVVDEAAQVPDDLFFAVRPMLLMSHGDMWLLSTPFGKRGHFFDLWNADDAAWTRVKVTAYDNPRVPPDFLAEERRTLPEQWFAQEYLCEFREGEDQVFRHEDVMRAFASEDEPLFQRPPDPGSVVRSPLGPLFREAA